MAKDFNKPLITILLILGIVVIVGMILNATGVYKFGQSAVDGTPVNIEKTGVQCNQNPAYSYSSVDTKSTTSVGGTDYIKLNGNAPVTSLASPTFGQKLQYWKSNSTYFTEVVSVDSVVCGSQSVQTPAYANGSVSLKVYDNDNAVFLTNGGGAQNVTIGANGVSNLESRYQGTAKTSAMPFGGCVAVEVPSTITNVALSGAGVTGAPCPYTWTYTVASTSNTYKLFAVPSGFDKDGLGDLKKLSLQLTAGSSDPSGTAKITYQPANTYIGNDGNFYMGIEKDKNQDTTKTFSGGSTFSFTIM